MPADLVPFSQDVPIVGEPMRIVAHWPTVVVNCHCEKGGVIVIFGTGLGSPCPACGNVYAILDPMQVRVGLVSKQQAGGVQ